MQLKTFFLFSFSFIILSMVVGSASANSCPDNCTYTLTNYTAEIVNGSIKWVKWTGINETFTWYAGGGTTIANGNAGFFAMFAGSFVMRPNVAAVTCNETVSTYPKQLNCVNSAAAQNYTFYNNYIKVDSYHSSAFRIYHYAEHANSTTPKGRVHNSTATYTTDSAYSWVTWYDGSGRIGISRPDHNELFMGILFDESKVTNFDIVINNDAAAPEIAVAIGRNSQIAAGTVFTSYLRVMRLNASASGSDVYYTHLAAFDTNKDFDDSADSCTYSSGDWNVNAADNCVITSSVNMGGNSVTVSGTGTFTIDTGGRVFNFDSFVCKDASVCTASGGNLG